MILPWKGEEWRGVKRCYCRSPVIGFVPKSEATSPVRLSPSIVPDQFIDIAPEDIELRFDAPDLEMRDSYVRLRPDGVYEIRATVPGAGGDLGGAPGSRRRSFSRRARRRRGPV